MTIQETLIDTFDKVSNLYMGATIASTGLAIAGAFNGMADVTFLGLVGTVSFGAVAADARIKSTDLAMNNAPKQHETRKNVPR